VRETSHPPRERLLPLPTGKLFINGEEHATAGTLTVTSPYDYSKKQCVNDMEDQHDNHDLHYREHDIDIVVDSAKKLMHNMLRVTTPTDNGKNTQEIYVQGRRQKDGQCHQRRTADVW
jgi:hypothetical protein